MHRDPRPRPIALALAVALAACLAPAAAQGTERPNVVLCMADDQGWGDVGYNGHPILQTPVLDAMAASGLRFDRFYAAAPVCSPTRGSVLTGRHPNRFGCFTWGYHIKPQEVTVAEMLRATGYATGHFGKWHLGSVRAGDPTSPGENGFDEWLSSPNFYENSPLMSRRGKVVEAAGESSRVAVDAALEFIAAAGKRGRRFLAVIWFGNPHTPHQALPELQKLYPDQPKRQQNYFGEITGIDRAMGHLRAQLRTLGLARNTIVWYTSDNGSRKPGSTGALRGRKGTLWEGGIRVPAVIEWPARITARRTNLPCNTIDILPTVLALCGARRPDGAPPLDGISLAPLLLGDMTARSKPLGFWVHPAPGRGVRSGQILQRLAQAQAGGAEDAESKPPKPAPRQHDSAALPGHAAWIDGGLKLHRIPDKKTGEVRVELYDLDADPAEQTELAAKQPERARAMRMALEQWQQSVVRSLRGGDY